MKPLHKAWRAWLLTDTPASRRQAALGLGYRRWRRFASNPLSVFGLVILILMIVFAAIGPLLPLHDPLRQVLSDRLLPPGSPSHWFGTDQLGRDILARLVIGSRLTLSIAILVVVLVVPVGLLIGTTAGFCGGFVDTVLMRLTDIALAFPKIVLALAFAAALGPGVINAVIAISITAWPPYARLARAETLRLVQADFIHVARLQGASSMRILLRYIVPLCSSSVIVRATLDMAGIILTVAGLGFLGLGAQPPSPEWGFMVASGRGVLLDAWWVATIPGIAILLVSLAFNLLGDGLRDVFDPVKVADMQADTLCEIDNLRIAFEAHDGTLTEAVRGISLTLARGERLGIVGESGSGKSLTGRALLGLLPASAHWSADAMRLDNHNLLAMRPKERRRLCGTQMSMILQDPKYSLNPVMTVAQQMCEAFGRQSPKLNAKAMRERIVAALEAVHIRDPQRVADAYPHELSGGMGQRVMIAMMVSSGPRLLIADEPTSALDVLVSMQVLSVLDEMIAKHNTGLIFISHDLPLVMSFCDRVLVMVGGRVVETCAARDLAHAQHPYTRGLLAASPPLRNPPDELPVLQRDPAWFAEVAP